MRSSIENKKTFQTNDADMIIRKEGFNIGS